MNELQKHLKEFQDDLKDALDGLCLHTKIIAEDIFSSLQERIEKLEKENIELKKEIERLSKK